MVNAYKMVKKRDEMMGHLFSPEESGTTKIYVHYNGIDCSSCLNWTHKQQLEKEIITLSSNQNTGKKGQSTAC